MPKILLLTAATALINTSCQDEFGQDLPGTSNTVAYNVDINNNAWVAVARSSKSNNNVNITSIDEGLRGDSLFLFTVVNDSIAPGIKNSKKASHNSRGTATTSATINDIGVTAVVYDGEWAEEGIDASIYMSNEKSVSPTWSTNRYWPQDGTNMRFFAYSPFDAINLPNETSSPVFDFEINKTASQQMDLLVASSDVVSPNGNKPADLTFAHALTAVKFEVANNVTDITVKAVRVNGVYYKGSYKYSYSGANKDDGDESTPYSSDMGQWTVVTDGENAVRSFEVGGLNIDCDGTAKANIPLNDGENVMMLMPQTLPAGATIEIDIHDDVLNQDVTLKASIAGNVWRKGTCVTYCISASKEIVEYIFETETLSEPDYYGGEGVFTVKSYKKTSRFGGVKIEPVAWDITDFNGSTERPKWLEEIQMSGNGVSNENDVETITYKMGAAPITKGESHDHFVAGAKRGTSSNPYDLSTNGGTTSQNTANCYMIGYAGHYKLPLVYGNGIVNGANHSTIRGDDYVDHRGRSWYTSPWITDRYKAHSVCIVWQDAPGLVSNLRLVDNGTYLAFDVNEHSVCDGNAVVAVKDENGDIMWSWHIWATNFISIWDGIKCPPYDTKDVKEKTIKNKTYGRLNEDGKLVNDEGKFPILDETEFKGNPFTEEAEKFHESYSFTMLNKYIGYCIGEKIDYNGTIACTLTQRVGGGSMSFDIKQKSHTRKLARNAVYYQFGRKDPMMGYGEYETEGEFYNKTCFGNDGKIVEFKYSASPASSIAETIKNPDVFYGAGSENWAGNIRYQFLWQARSYNIPNGSTIKTLTDRERVSKTVYDPCPAGYLMPRSDAFTGFLLDSANPNKQVEGCPEEYRAYLYYKDDSTIGYKKESRQSSIGKEDDNNNGNILSEEDPCAFVSGYEEFAYWFRPDVNGAGKYDGSLDINKMPSDSVYNKCLLLYALGCRGSSSATDANVREYRHMGNAMTATLVNKNNTGERPSRLYFYHDHNGQYLTHNCCYGHVNITMQDPLNPTYTTFSSNNKIFTVASSKMSVGFNVLPAKEGANGHTQITK